MAAHNLQVLLLPQDLLGFVRLQDLMLFRLCSVSFSQGSPCYTTTEQVTVTY